MSSRRNPVILAATDYSVTEGYKIVYNNMLSHGIDRDCQELPKTSTKIYLILDYYKKIYLLLQNK